MSLEQLSSLAQVFGSIGVIVSLIFVGLQIQQNTAALQRYMRGEDPDPDREEYGRYGNPTVRELERRVAALEGAEDGVAFSSGMAAMTTAILASVKAGEHVVLFRDCYRRIRQLVTVVLPRIGIEHLPPDAREAYARELRRVGRRWFVQTPNRGFPIEPHALLPFAQPLAFRFQRTPTLFQLRSLLL